MANSREPSDQKSPQDEGPPLLLWPFVVVWEGLKQGWAVLKRIYWYNSIAWRVLKSGALVVFGFFFLAGANLLHSFKPNWDFLYLFMSYGFLMIVYGPIHHILIIPISLRLNHYAWGRKLKIGKRVPFNMMILFSVAVVVFGVYPLDVMTFRFEATASSQPDINPKLTCSKSPERDDTVIRCSLRPSEGIDTVRIINAGRRLTTLHSPPFGFSVRESELEEVVGRKSIEVELRDTEGRLLRRYVRSVGLIEPEPEPADSRD